MSARRPLSSRARTTVRAALVAWIGLLAVVLLAPSSAGPDWVIVHLSDALRGLGLPEGLAHPRRVEWVLNIAAFVPLGLLGSLLWTGPTWRDWTAVGFVASLLVEAFQAVALGARQATNADVVANTLGMLLGALLGLLAGRILGASALEGGADLPDRPPAAEELEPPR